MTYMCGIEKKFTQQPLSFHSNNFESHELIPS